MLALDDPLARTGGWEPAVAQYLGELEARGKPVVYCGDLNVAHTPLDLWGNHAANEKSAGYTPEERAAFGGLLVGSKRGGGLGLVVGPGRCRPPRHRHAF